MDYSSEDRNNVAADLARKIDTTNETLDLLEFKYYEKSLSRGADEEKDRLHAAFVEETRKMQRFARYNVQRILSEQEKMRCELEKKEKKLSSWNEELNKREAIIERERLKLDEDRKQVMKHIGDVDDDAVQKKMKEMADELESKVEDLEDMESRYNTLIVKERQSNDELQEARKELITENWKRKGGTKRIWCLLYLNSD